MTPTSDQFAGCLFGLAIGDALGAPVEGLGGDLIRSMGPADKLVTNPSGGTLYYTDDTQMTIGVAETLVDCGEIREKKLCAAFAENYDPNRGYGQGARRVIEAMAAGDDYRELAGSLFPGGSYGNGAAMRVAPVGLLFCDDLERVATEAERSSKPTHVHPLGIDGARLIALSVALALRGGPFRREKFLTELLHWAQTEEFKWQLGTLRELAPSDSLISFGISLEAHRSVVTAIACFTSSPDDYSAVVSRAIGQGNDTDTLAAMAGAIAGSRLGISAIPTHLIDALEDRGKGRRHLTVLAERLHRQYVGHRKFTEKDSGNEPKHRWYQFSLLELLLVTTICAVALGVLRLVGTRGLWGEFGTLSVYGFYLVLILRRLRRKCIENDVWFPDQGQPESDES
jgi:poly(ADP-ribose) glycohydrolase ARH3